MNKNLNRLAEFLKHNGFKTESENILLIKNAGMFSAPPKMVSNLKRWVRQKIIAGLLHYMETEFTGNDFVKNRYPKTYQYLSDKTTQRNEIFSNSTGSISGSTKIDLNDWNYTNEAELEAVKKVDKRNRFKKLEVHVKPHARDLGRAGGYGEFWGLQINPENPLKSGKSDSDLLDYMEEYFYKIDTTIEHELIHFGQNILKYIKTLTEEHTPSSPSSFGEPGLKEQTDPEILQQTLEPNPHDNRFAKEYLKNIEYYTHLHNQIREAKFNWGKDDNQNSFSNFKSFVLKFIKNSLFFQTLKKHNKALYKKSVSLFYQELIKDQNFTSDEADFVRTNYQIGDKIRILAGPYKGLQAEIVAIENDAVKVQINMFGRPMVLNNPLDPSDFEIL